MSEMEPDIKTYFKKLAVSVYLGLFWLLLFMTFGIYFGLLFIKGGIRPGNLLFYGLSIAGFIWLIRFYVKTWKKKFPHG